MATLIVNLSNEEPYENQQHEPEANHDDEAPVLAIVQDGELLEPVSSSGGELRYLIGDDVDQSRRTRPGQSRNRFSRDLLP